MTAGRPPTTVDGQLRAATRRVAASMPPGDRLAVMEALLRNIATEVRMSRRPAQDALVRLAAHCLAWANETEAGE